MVIPRADTFFVGLVLAAGGGDRAFETEHQSAIVGGLLFRRAAPRGATPGFTIFYMGINLRGSSWVRWYAETLGRKYNWHYGFGAAGVGHGKKLGLIQYPADDPPTRRGRPASGTS